MEPFAQPLRQPDQRSCGAAVLVVARMLHDADYASYVDSVSAFEQEVLAVHRRVTGTVDALGRAQLPWPQALGTPPWAVAREMSVITGTPYRSHFVRQRPGRVLDEVVAAVDRGNEVPLFIGNRWLPRHVVLVLDAALTTYDPSRGRRITIDRHRFESATLEVAGWSHPWLVALPNDHSAASAA